MSERFHAETLAKKCIGRVVCGIVYSKLASLIKHGGHGDYAIQVFLLLEYVTYACMGQEEVEAREKVKLLGMKKCISCVYM